MSAVEGRVSMLEWRKWDRAGEYDGALPANELDGTDWNEREKAEEEPKRW